MSSVDSLAKDLYKIIKSKEEKGPKPYEPVAEVVKVDDDTVWVKIPGGDSETPVEKTVNAKVGDRVRLRLSGGRGWVLGNASNPPTDDTRAIVAQNIATGAEHTANRALDEAESAMLAATTAWDYADSAHTAADTAHGEAQRATRYANNALAGLGTLESVIDTVNWFAEHKKASTDTTVNPNKTYYIYDETTGTLSAVTPEGTENPSEEGWYELDEAIANYVATHVATTDDGLYVVGMPNGWKVLVSSGTGDYTPGVFIVDDTGGIAQATTATGITFDDTKPFYIGDEDAFIVFDGNGHLTISGNGMTLGSESLSSVLSKIGASLKAVEYGKGSSPTSHSDIISWSSNTPTWEEGKYIWMRTTTNGLNYTYTCIQGAEGPQGDPGQPGSSIGITSIRYAVSTTEAQPDDSAFTYTTVPTVAEGRWLWTRTLYSDGTSAYTKSKQGESGSSVTVSKIEYGTSDNASTQPASWSQQVPTSIAQGKWLWVKTTYNNGSNATTKSYIGTDGEDGNSVYVKSITKVGDTTTVILSDGTTDSTMTIVDGEDGDNGQPGASGYVHVAWANSADGSVDFSTSVSTNKQYLGVYTDNTAADSQRYQDYSWSLIKGAKGDAASIYYLQTSADALINNSGTLTPSTVTFSAKKIDGVNAPANYSGRFIIAESTNGTSWTNKYTSSSNESSKVYTPSSASIKLIRCTLYLAGGTTTALDTQTVAIVEDGADGDPAYTVILTNEAHTFAGGTSAALAGTATCGIIAYKGATQVTCYAGSSTSSTSISTGITGLTCSISNNNTSNVSLTFTATTSLTTKSGQVSIPIHVDGKTFTKQFTFSVALKGEQGAPGDPGADGKMLYATCSTEADVVAKVATIEPTTTLTLYKGLTVAVKFTYENISENPTLNINSTGAKSIYAGGTNITGNYNWENGDTCIFVYDGTNWQLTNQNNDVSGDLISLDERITDVVTEINTEYSEFEKILGGDGWIATHGIFDTTEDTEVVPGKYYFALIDNEYVRVEPGDGVNPSAQGYYELLSADETLSQYLSSRLIEINNELLIQSPLTDANQELVIKSKLKLTPTGIHLLDESGDPVATFAKTITLGDSEKLHVNLSGGNSEVTPPILPKLAFLDGTTEVAYINSETLFINQARINNELRIGQFRWQTQGTNRISLIYDPI